MGTTVVEPSTFLMVRKTCVPFGPLMSLMTSSSRMPTTSTGVSSTWATFKILSPGSINFPRHTGPPEMTSTISIS